ncbi:MAG TPA: hypothetical protein DF427_10675 [Moraxellaceae bacterium]|nr:hypothetical protein [Moraxellaceae bacterium]
MMKRLLLVLPLAALLLAGCQMFSGTQVEKVSSQKPEAATMKKVLVIGVKTTPEIQKAMEKAFSERLKKHGTTVVLGSDWFPGAELPTRQQVVERVKAEGVTGVLVTSLLNFEVAAVEEQYSTFILSAPSRTPEARVGWSDVWVSGHENAQQVRDSAPIVERTAVIETRLYDAVSEKVVWEARARMEVGLDAERNLDGFVSAIIAQLHRNGWL